MKDFKIEDNIIQYSMNILVIDKSMDFLDNKISPITYLCDEAIKNGATYKIEHRSYYSFFYNVSNLKIILDILKSTSFKNIFQDFINDSTGMSIDIDKIEIYSDIHTFNGFFRTLEISVILKNSFEFINKQKIKDFILKNHISLNLTPYKTDFDIYLNNKDTMIVKHKIHYKSEIKPDSLNYVKDIKKSFYKIKYSKDYVILEGQSTLNFNDTKDISNG